MILSLCLGIAALLFSLMLTPLVRNLFLHLGLVDRPDQDRKLHNKGIPRVGGIAVILSYFLAFLLLSGLPVPGYWLVLHGVPARWPLMLLSVLIVFGTGILDDLAGLRPKQKLLGQVLAAVIAWNGGVQVHLFPRLAIDVWLSLPLTIVWILACSNAFNLIDGVDGLATGTALFATTTILIAAVLDHNVVLVLMTLPLVGCLLGFLRYNFNPASIFLGDCGSLTIGFLLGCFGALWAQKINTLVGLSAPAMALSIPLIDTSLAIARRFVRRRPIFSADRGHIHHRLLDRGNSPKQTAITLYVMCAIAAIFSLSQQIIHRRYAGFIVLGFVIAVCAGVRYLGYLEFGLVQKLLRKGVLFHLVEDHLRLDALEKNLAATRSAPDAIEMIRKTCVELGFTEIYVSPRGPAVLVDRHSAAACSLHIPIGNDRCIVLQGLSMNERPLALAELVSVITRILPDYSWGSAALEPQKNTPAASHYPRTSGISVVTHLGGISN